MNLIKKILKKFPALVYIAASIPFITACYGYSLTGELSFWEIIYAAIAIYFVNPISDITNGYILFSEITSVIVTAGIILSILKYALKKVSNFFIRFRKDATVVYTDNRIGKELADSLKHGYMISTAEKPEKVLNHILMFSDDTKNVSFYSRNESILEESNVYLFMSQLDYTLLKVADSTDANLHFFNVNDLVARDYWKNNNIYDYKDRNCKIAIIGSTDIGKAIFKYGYLNNIYTLNQTFEYHLYGYSGPEVEFLKNLKADNSDKIILHDDFWENDSNTLSQMDRVIYAENTDQLNLIQKLLFINPTAEIHCYSPEDISYEDVYATRKLMIFGNISKIISEENIKNETLYRLGKLFHYDYTLRSASRHAPENFEEEMEAEWVRLDGFKKSSNIARADHFWIEKRLKDDGILTETDEEAWHMEHIRWCRFHYINHWSYSETRDNARRKHNLLVPYEDLPSSEKPKDGIYDDRIREEINSML